MVNRGYYHSFDIEIFLREIVKEAYQIHCDDEHTTWKLNLLDHSLVCNHYILETNYNNWLNKILNKCVVRNSTIGKNYWEELIYKIFEHICSKLNNIIISLNLGKQLENKKKLELEKKKKN